MIKTHLLIICLIFSSIALYACSSESDSSSTDDSPIINEDNLPELLASQLVAQKNVSILAAEGGVVELNGASLSAPANALAQDVRLGLASVSVSVNTLPENDGARLGLKVVSPEAYLLFSDADVELSQSLTLRLPLDPDLLPKDVVAEEIQLASQMGGFLVPFGAPSRVDLENNFVEVDLDMPRFLAYGADQIMTEAPRAASTAFLVIMAGLATTPWTWNAILVAINDVTQKAAGRTLTKRLTPHFAVFIDESRRVSLLDVIAVENALEQAYEVFVDDLDMSLPNLINLDGRYTVVLDDFSLYSALPIPANTPEGFTLAGSSLVEGISYINANLSRDQMKNVAVHEYFHALQWGALRSPFIWNIGEKKLDQQTAAQSGWLFEGSATALAGRIIDGNVVNAARDSDFDKRMPQGVALFASEAKYGMAHDVAQDFFFYLERQFGDYDFYPDMFANISPSLFDERESAVRAADIVIQDISDGDLDMSKAWENFVVDYWVDNNHLYEPTYSIDAHSLNDQAKEILFSYPMPALSQRVFSINVAALQKDDQGNVLPNQATDLELEVNMTTNDGSINQVPITIVDELKSNTARRFPWFASSLSARTQEFKNFRQENERKLFFVMSFPELAAAANATLSFQARLSNVESLFEATFNIPGVNIVFNPDNALAIATLWANAQQTMAVVGSEGNAANSEHISITFNPNMVSGPGTYSVSSNLAESAAIFLFSSPVLKNAAVGAPLGGIHVPFSAHAGSITINAWSTEVGSTIGGTFSTQVSGMQITGKEEKGGFISKEYNGTITGSFSVNIVKSSE